MSLGKWKKEMHYFKNLHASFSSISPLEVIEKFVMNSTKSIVPFPSSSNILKTLTVFQDVFQILI